MNTESRLRKNKNMEEINQIQNEASLNKKEKEKEIYRKKTENKCGTFLDASGKTHLKKHEHSVYQNENQVFSEIDDPNSKLWADSTEENFPRESTINSHGCKAQKDVIGYCDLSAKQSFVESVFSNMKSLFSLKDIKTHHRLNPKRKLKQLTPLQPTQPKILVKQFEIKAVKYIILACSLCFIMGRLGFGIILILSIIGFCSWTYWNICKTSFEGLEWQLEKQESIKTLYTTEGESVEWLNYIIEKIWLSVDPKLFTSIEDMLEDTIESIAPSIIKGVKVSDFDIGVKSPCIQKIRVFPPFRGQHEESIFGEASFVFSAKPYTSLIGHQASKSAPPGLSVRFQTAINAPLEVKTELIALSGKMRFKLLTDPEIPFISKVKIAFTSVPKIETSVMPLSKHLNIMNLPTIKTIVNEGIKLGFSDFVDPKSLTVDVRDLIGVFSQDTNAIGIVKVEIKEASKDSSLKIQDMEDSYATLSSSTQPKSRVHSTRVLKNDKNPKWNENLYVLVYTEDIISDATIKVEVWDADKIKCDDLWGSVSMSVRDIVGGQVDKLGNNSSWSQDERIFYDGWIPIDGNDMEISKVRLNMKLSFHPKYTAPNTSFLSCMKPKNNSSKEKIYEESLDPEHKNGILSVTIDQAADLEIGDPALLPSDDRFKHPYNPNSVVNPYAILYINDDKVYQTRTKLLIQNPHWNAITEHFIHDADNSFIRISIKTALELERNPVIGTKVITLKDLFDGQGGKFKNFKKWIPLSNGIGFGKVLLGVKYKPVKMNISRALQGSNIGTLIIERISLNQLKNTLDPTFSGATKATLTLNIDPVIIKRLKSHDLSIENGVNGWYNRHLYFPLTMRYHTAIYVHISQGTLTSAKATGRLWLKEIVENEWHDVVIGLHSYMNERSKEANKNEDLWPEKGEFGQISIRLKILCGFSPIHTNLGSFRKDMVGADPFYEDALRYKAQKWIEEKGKYSDSEPSNIDLQHAIEEEVEKRRDSSKLSSEYRETSDNSIIEEVDVTDLNDNDIKADMINQRKTNKVSRFRIIRKMAWSVDKLMNKVDLIREGFNSERRTKRSVAKEV